MEDFINQRLTVTGCTKLSVFRTSDGRFQANLENADRSYTVDTSATPADAIWNVLVPYQMRRTAPSGRTMAIATAAPVAALDLLASTPHPTALEDLLA